MTVNFIHPSLVELLGVSIRRAGGALRVFIYALCTLSTTSDAATLSNQQLSSVWRETFPVANVEMAPSTLPNANAVPLADVRLRPDGPHPAVARIIVPEQGAISYGSGTLIDVRDHFGLVITNWHVVRDATDTIEVMFPDGFTSKARALKVDSDWDLAALVIWRPKSIEPVKIACEAPRPGDQLTICGYGQGNYRCATGRCTQYYAPRRDFPRHMVELDVEARQGDSGGPIFNDSGELAGVLFGAGQGTTLGSFGGRVGAFLATLAPDIGRAAESLANNPPAASPCIDNSSADERDASAQRAAVLRPVDVHNSAREFAASEKISHQASQWPSEASKAAAPADSGFPKADIDPRHSADYPAQLAGRENLFEQMKTVLAAIGLVTVVVQALRVAR